MAQFMQEGGDEDMMDEDEEEDVDDFLSDKPSKASESKEERDMRIKRELEARKKGDAHACIHEYMPEV